VGLAAPQVGVNVRLMVFNPAGRRGEGEELVLANPRIVSVSKGRELAEEGCLSFHRLGTRDLVRADVEVGPIAGNGSSNSKRSCFASLSMSSCTVNCLTVAHLEKGRGCQVVRHKVSAHAAMLPF